jgi:hypothetical protein
LVNNTSANASSINTANTASASRPLTLPVAKGRERVRATCGSSQRSA